jgi:dihydroxyacetone kinase DhaKLM complex PTS-EIIA-like component DhaM
MVSLVFISHSRALAQSATDLVRQTVAPDLPLAFAGGTGQDHQEFGTDDLGLKIIRNSELTPLIFRKLFSAFFPKTACSS